MKFGTVMHNDPFDASALNISEFQQSKMAAAAILKNSTRPAEVVLAAKRW